MKKKKYIAKGLDGLEEFLLLTGYLVVEEDFSITEEDIKSIKYKEFIEYICKGLAFYRVTCSRAQLKF